MQYCPLNCTQSCTQCGTPTYQWWDLSKLPFLRYHVYKVFTIWPLLTPNDLWPPPKTKGFMHAMWYTYIPIMRSVQVSLLEMSCLQGFHNLTLVDPNDLWPPPKTIGFLHAMWYTYIRIMRSVQVSLLEMSCLQSFHNLTPVDPKWPLTSTKNNRLLVLNVVHLHTNYKICPSFPSWDIVFTRFSQFDPCWPKMTFDLHQKQ